MVSPRLALKSIAYGIKELGFLPDDVSYSILELDYTGQQAPLRPPILELVYPRVVRNNSLNSERVGYETDSSGNKIGEIYRASFEMDVDIRVITHGPGDRDHRRLAHQLRQSLRAYDASEFDMSLPDPRDDRETLDDVRELVVRDSGLENDLSMSGAMRAIQQDVTCTFVDELSTSDMGESLPYVAEVDVDVNDGSAQIELTTDSSVLTE